MSETIEITCGCGGVTKYPADFAGQLMSCLHCGQEFRIPYANVPAHDETEERRATITLSDAARASNPGDLSPNLARWFTYYPKWPLIWGISLTTAVAAGILIHWAFWIPAIPLAAMNYLYWQRVREHFLHGCAVPGVVIRLDPMMLAFSTDMSTGLGEYPAVRVIQKEFRDFGGDTPRVGTRLVGIALYGTSDASLPHWEDFDPRPIQSATGDLDEHSRLMSSMNEDDFRQLLQWLQPVPFEPGLYFINNDGTATRYEWRSKSTD